MEPLPVGVRQPPGPPRPPAPPTTGGGNWGPGGFGDFGSPRLSRAADHRRTFGRAVVVEMRKVAWPARQDLVHNAAVCLGALTVFIGGLAVADTAIGALLRAATGGG